MYTDLKFQHKPRAVTTKALLSQSKTCSDRNNELSPDFHCKVLNRLYKKIFYIFDGVSASEHGHGGHVIEVIYLTQDHISNTCKH